ncbi:MAG: hypothetical protein SGJ27_24370 [Candidatus Melainabacteria bacterium]|nr:hypothetical protein [Candidatus Melainabacteria bacterium]
MYNSYSTDNARSVPLVPLILGLGVAFVVGFGALCYANGNIGNENPGANPMKQSMPSNMANS